MSQLLKRISPLFGLTVLLPTILGALYFGFFAEDVYISQARITVRNPGKQAVSPLSAVLSQSGLDAPNEGNDTVMAYLSSRQAIADSNHDGYLMRAYADPALFLGDRFGGLSGKSGEEFFEYFSDKLTVEEGTSTQVLTVSVRAFDPSHAREINARLMARSEALINSLSQRAREDAVALAEAEVEEASEAAREAALALSQFRNRNQIVDPEQESAVTLEMISKLQDGLITAQTRLRQLQKHTPRAPQIGFLETQTKALRLEIEEEQKKLVGGSDSLSSSMVKYQELQLNSELAEKQLAVVLAGWQDAKAEERRKRAYVEQIAPPSLPDYPVEPRRIRGILATFILGLLAWGVMSMLAIGVREHKD